MGKPVSPRGQGRQRVLDAALTLFATKGVDGTSLQDIADLLGIGKAAVYYQFKSKQEIVHAVVEPALAGLEDVAAASEREPDVASRRQRALEGLVDRAIQDAAVASFVQRDPALAALAATSQRVRDVQNRLLGLLSGDDPSPSARVAVILVGHGMVAARLDPSVADVDDVTLRAELLAAARRALPPLPAA